MQDFTGVPAVVDLAAMRDAMTKLGGDAEKINPLVPVDLVIDHSVIVDEFGNAEGLQEERRSRICPQRRALPLPEMGPAGVLELPVVPPGTGICHQVNLEYPGPDRLDQEGKVQAGARQASTVEVAYPDSLVGTDSHTTMVNGLAVLGWGVGGIEAEACMLGQPLSMLLPEVDRLRADRQAEGRRHRDRSRAHRHADAAQEGRRRQVRRVLRPGPRISVARRPRDHRQHGAGIWRDLRLLPGRHRDARLPEDHQPLAVARRAGRKICQGAGHVPHPHVARSGLHRHAATSISPTSCRRWPARSVRKAASRWKASAPASPPRWRANTRSPAKLDKRFKVEGANYDIGHGDVVIAAITSCTNTSNPCVLIGAGLLARNAAEPRA